MSIIANASGEPRLLFTASSISSTGDAAGGTPAARRRRSSTVGEAAAAGPAQCIFPIVKELCYNKCPAVAPIGVLEKNGGWEKIGLSRELVERNLQELLEHPEFAEKVRTAFEARSEFPKALEPEEALYDGFLNERDRIKVAAVRNAGPSKIADFHPDFDDERLPELLLHYKGRNFPDTLSDSEMEKYEAYRKERQQRQAGTFMQELEKVQDEFLRQELLLYMQSLV